MRWVCHLLIIDESLDQNSRFFITQSLFGFQRTITLGVIKQFGDVKSLD